MKPDSSANRVTELTVMVCRFAAGTLWWKLSSSAAEAMTGTSRLQAYSIAARAKDVLFTVPSASCTTCAPLSTAKTTPCAKRFESATKLSPTRTGSTMQLGQVPSAAAVVGLGGRVLGLAGAVAVRHLVERVVVVVEEVPAGDVVDVAVARRRRCRR